MNALLEAISLIPPHLGEAVRRHARTNRVSEIRLRAHLPLSVTVNGENRLLDERGHSTGLRHALRATDAEISETVSKLCEGSVYRHAHTLSRGFVVTDFGVRAGLSGVTLRDKNGETHTSLSDFTGINLRIPYAVRGAADVLLSFYRTHGLRSTLVYSKPGVGKTTLLRDLALSLSSGALGSFCRVAVLDERGELFPKKSEFQREGGLLDVLSGHGKAEGIELATRLLAPEVILCDELGGEDEARTLLEVQNSGVIFIASVHAGTAREAAEKPEIAALLRARLFSCLCRAEWDRERETTRLFVEEYA